jgi:hypothetical protein
MLAPPASPPAPSGLVNPTGGAPIAPPTTPAPVPPSLEAMPVAHIADAALHPAPIPPSASQFSVPTLPTVAPPAPAAAPGPTSPQALASMYELGAAEAWRHAKPTRTRRRGSGFFRAWFLLRVVGALIALTIGGIGAVKNKYFGDSQSTAPDAPSEWPVGVEPIAAFVEAERGLKFDHPVAIEFLSEAEYVEYFSAGAYEPTPAEIEQYSQLSAVYDAAGLAVDFDLLAGQSTFTSVGTLGLYIPEEDRIYIRGSELTPAVRVVVAHELTHALQAQHFTLPLGGPNDLSVRSIVEADALRVENVYFDTLPEAEQTLATAALTIDEASSETLSSVPSALIELNSAPYVLGPVLVESVFASNGNDGVNQLLQQPPTEEVLINPRLFGTATTDAEPLVSVPFGATVIEDVEQLSMLDTLSLLDAWRIRQLRTR